MNVLVVKCGSTSPEVRLAHGDYDRWFLRALAGAPVRLQVVEAHAGAALPARSGRANAVVVTGSPRSLAEHAPWMRWTADWLRETAEAGTPVLGVCFGHQLLAEAYGGAVARSPGGREIGTVACELTAAGRDDALFDGVPPRFEAQATHEDEVRALPARAELLATNAASPVQAFRIGRRVRAVQFHPELDAATMSALIRSRAALLEAEARARGADPEQRLRGLRAGVRATPHGQRILENFLRLA